MLNIKCNMYCVCIYIYIYIGVPLLKSSHAREADEVICDPKVVPSAGVGLCLHRFGDPQAGTLQGLGFRV